MIKELLSEGPENAINGRDICQLLGLSMRELTAAVERERRAGAPICATNGRYKPGYYLAPDRETMEDYCRRLQHRAGEMQKTRRYCMKTAKGLPERKEKALHL